jgi:hypothetical protein
MPDARNAGIPETEPGLTGDQVEAVLGPGEQEAAAWIISTSSTSSPETSQREAWRTMAR